jgi:uncharacterized protein YheU (UPF0270 family)
MIIPPNRLGSEALQNLLESFITRDGTDYGEHEWSLEDKVAQLRPKVLKGEVLILFDEESESITLVSREEIGDVSF